MKLQTRIFIYFGPILLITVASLFLINYIAVQKSLRQQARLELKKIHESVYLSTESLLSTAITNYLRGITEKNLDIINFYYDEFQKGNISEKAAKDSVQKKCLLQKVGKTGYLVAVGQNDSGLTIDIHPHARFQSCNESEACIIWNKNRSGYVEYQWKNPSEEKIRKKVAYIEEFKPWNWVFGATSYKDEFINLVQVDDLKKLIKPIKINESGYFYLFDKSHKLLIHPELEGKYSKDLLTKDGKELIPLLVNDDDGYVEYLWKNPSEKKYRSKYAYVKEIPFYNWYLGASGYMEDIEKPLIIFKIVTLFIIIISSLILLLLAVILSKQITNPLKRITIGIDNFYSKKSSFNWKASKVHEIDYLGTTFSKLTNNLQTQMIELNKKIEELDASNVEKEEITKFLENIINSMPSIVIGITPDFIITQWNNNAEEKTKILKEDAINGNLFSLFPELKIHFYEIKNALEKTNTIKFQLKTKNRADNFIHYEVTVYPLANPGRTSAVIRIDDTTERVELENELSQSRKMEAIGQLAGGVAHDFNNMLTGILTSVENLEDNIKNQININSLKVIKDAALRTRDLTKNLLNFSRQKVKGYSPLKINDVIESTIHMLKHSISKNVSIEYINEAINDTIMGDFSQIQNVLLNMGINSDHAMEKAGKLIYKTSNITINDEEKILIEIKDNGQGIPDDIKDKIFNPFFTTKKQGQGTGLGLASVYATIEQHGGKVSFDSEIGKGTTFKIELPLTKKKVSTSKSNKTTILPENFSNKKILVIDDEKIVRHTIITMLESFQFNVCSASNGYEGLEKYKNEYKSIDLVILDMRMPGIDGPECFKKLKEINPKVKVIISSGYSKEGTVEELEKDGLAGFVSKPYRRVELLKVISDILDPDPESL